MMECKTFDVVGMKMSDDSEGENRVMKDKKPVVSIALLCVIIAGCVFADFITVKNPDLLNLQACSHSPNREFWFGTDTLGRDIFACIWHGGRISILIGFLSTVISTFIAVVYGAISGISPGWLDTLLMRLTDIFLSVPTLLTIIFIQAIMGEPNVFSISTVIGISSWYSIAKVVRTEVRQIRNSEYIVASKCMGGGFFHILRVHLAPNFVSSIMFMIVMNVRAAIVAESTLSFLGMGLPIEVISWGSMLSLAEKALMTNAWWIILVPGIFLVALLMCLTNIGNWLRASVNRKDRNL